MKRNGRHATERTQAETLLKVLAVSDLVEPQLYHPDVADRIGTVDLIISCGDLPPQYLDFLGSALNAPLMHVVGNHCSAKHDAMGHCSPMAYDGAYNIGGRAATFHRMPGEPSLLLAGIEGSPRYNRGPHQYIEPEVEFRLLRTAPGLILNKLRLGRYLDIFVTHAPPRGIHDLGDIAHKGFQSFLPFLKYFRPTLMLHGHTHRYDPTQPIRTQHNDTLIINVYGHTRFDLRFSSEVRRWELVTKPLSVGNP